MTNRNIAYSKGMQDHPTRAYFTTHGETGILRDMRDIRFAMDDCLFGLERGALPKALSTDLATTFVIDEGRAGAKIFLSTPLGVPTKAHADWTYDTGKVITVTAVKPGEIGNRLHIVFASGADDGIVVAGDLITITIDNDDATVPSDLQVIVAASATLKQLIAITSTDDAAIPHEFGAGAPEGDLMGGRDVSGKASATWTYDTGELLTVTAVRAGKLGNQIKIVFASGTADAVSLSGSTVTITIDNDDATLPSDLQAIVAASPTLSQLIVIRSTSDAAIPNAFAAAGPSGYLAGGSGPYVKAGAAWTYATGKVLTVTAVKPGELGNRIQIVFDSDASDSVTCVGNVITIKIDNDEATLPSDLQTLVAADRKACQLITITSTDNTAIPDAFAAAHPTGYLAGGLGLGWGGYLSAAWEDTSSVLFLATKPGMVGAKYKIEWQTGNANAVPTITATGERCIIKYKAVNTTAAQVVAAVNADHKAKEYLLASAPGGGAGNIAVAASVVELGEDQGTTVYLESFQGEIVEVEESYVMFNLAANSGVAAAVLAELRLTSGLVNHGKFEVLTAAT